MFYYELCIDLLFVLSHKTCARVLGESALYGGRRHRFGSKVDSHNISGTRF